MLSFDQGSDRGKGSPSFDPEDRFRNTWTVTFTEPASAGHGGILQLRRFRSDDCVEEDHTVTLPSENPHWYVTWPVLSNP